MLKHHFQSVYDHAAPEPFNHSGQQTLVNKSLVLSAPDAVSSEYDNMWMAQSPGLAVYEWVRWVCSTVFRWMKLIWLIF